MRGAGDPGESWVELTAELRGRVVLGLAGAAPVRVGPAGAALQQEMDALALELRERHAGRAPSGIADLAPARELYRAFGVDPTKTRPSSEALLRRILRGDALPRILNAVDLCNLLAVRFLLPIGLYDSAKIVGGVVLRTGAPGESYQGIRKDEVHLAGRPVLVDEHGPFGNPTSDSLRTSVDESTTALWMVIFGPGSLPRSRMTEHVEVARRGLAAHVASPDDAVRTSGALAS